MATTNNGTNILTGYQSQTSSVGATQKGTKIVDSSGSMDKNSFLKILTTELSNQDPSSANNDPTQYVAQLAQFSSLEQMANLNGTMTFNAASSLIGKSITLNVPDSDGNDYNGVVKSINKNGDTVSLKVQVNEGGKNVVKTFDYKDVIDVNADGYNSNSSENTTSTNTSSV